MVQWDNLIVSAMAVGSSTIRANNFFIQSGRQSVVLSFGTQHAMSRKLDRQWRAE